MRNQFLAIALIFGGATACHCQERSDVNVTSESRLDDRAKTFTLADLPPACRVDGRGWRERISYQRIGLKGQTGGHEMWACQAKYQGPPRKSLTSELDLYADSVSAEAGFVEQDMDMMKILPGAVDWSSRVHLGQKCKVIWSPDLNSLYVSVQDGTRLARLSSTGIVFAEPNEVEGMIGDWIKREPHQ